MKNQRTFCKALALTLALLSLTATGLAQTVKATFSPTVSAAAAPQQVRFLAASEAAQLRLEVFALGGAQLYDSDFKPGNLFDWNLQDQQGQRLAEGVYRCLLTVKDAAGRTSQRQGLLLVQADAAAWQSPEQAELMLRSFNPASASERVEFFTTVPAGQELATTALAHDGSVGRLMTSSGALSFRIGDFLASKDKEQMRLTADGKLDVAGLIRTSEGIVFPDGTIQTTAYVASGRNLSERSGLQRDESGRSVAERTEPAQKNSAGGLGQPVKTNIPDDLVVSGNVFLTDLGTNNPRDIRTSNNNAGLRFSATNGPLTVSPNGAAIQFWGNNSSLPGQVYLDAGAHNNGALIFRTAQAGEVIKERMRVSAHGAVGIGTNNPEAAKLHVEGGNSGAIYAHNSTISAAVKGENDFSGPGVSGTSNLGPGVDGWSNNDGPGVSGTSSSGSGVQGFSSTKFGVWGGSTSGYGVYGDSTSSFAGYFKGKVNVTGTLSKGGGSFKIDHPLDPENKYLYHSFVESPDMMNIYNGNVTTDANGEAEVTLPDYFTTLNRDFRYQLTCLGSFAQAMVAEEIKDNHFKIRTSLPNVKISWLVTGVRQDAFANANRIPVEELKPEKERGSYLHPAAFGKPEEQSLEWALHPEMMRQQKAARAQAAAKSPQGHP